MWSTALLSRSNFGKINWKDKGKVSENAVDTVLVQELTVSAPTNEKGGIKGARAHVVGTVVVKVLDELLSFLNDMLFAGLLLLFSPLYYL